MKLSVSIPEDDLTFLDQYIEKLGIPSRSAAVQKAIRLLRTAELAEAYEAAYEEWHGSEDAMLWDRTVGDGIG
jgi:metal-responsive CopG/Arc/MetJ family transcriptional regulator